MSLQSFHWIVPQQLAGSGVPGWNQDIRQDFKFLWEQGIRVILTLLEKPLPLISEDYPLTYVHFPIVDMKVPISLQSTHKICKAMAQHMRDNQGVLVHCEAGTGRTGTILACILLHFEKSAEEAICEIRKIESLYIRNTMQENFVHRYATYLKYL